MPTIEDEVTALLCDGIRAMGEPIEPAHISYEDDVRGRIRYEGPLPAVFRPGVVVASFDAAGTIADAGGRAGESIRLLRQDLDRHAESLSRGLRLARRMAATEPRIVVISHERDSDGEHRLRAVVEVSTLDDALRPSTTRASVGERGFEADLPTMRTLRGQARRRAALERGMTIERTLAHVAGDHLKELVAHLLEMPSDPETQGWESGAWTAKRLGQHGIRLPGGIETVRVRDGRVFGRVRLSADTTWTDGTLLHRTTELPGTAIQALLGKPLRTLIDHEALPAEVAITQVGVDGHGQLRVKTVPLDDGIAF